MPKVQTNRSVTVGKVIDKGQRQNPAKATISQSPKVRVTVGVVRSPKYILETSEDEMRRGLFCGRGRG
jgi:hypothetical protein